MDWEIALRRQILGEWRDRQILAACETLNEVAQVAQQRFEAQLNEANLIDTVWDPARFATQRIDALLRDTVPQALKKFLEAAADELRGLDPAFASYADALARSEGFILPDCLPMAEALPADTGPKSSKKAMQLAGWGMFDFAIVQRARGAGERAATAIWEFGNAAERAIQDGAGLYARLRTAATQRISAQWMGGAGDPRPVLAQVIDLIDGVTGEARTNMT